MRLRYAAKTDVGMKRAYNEDYFSLIEWDKKVFLVADGMGGHACGEVASKLSGDVISEFYQHSKDMDATWPYRYDPALSYPENRMVAAVRLAIAGEAAAVCSDYIWVLDVCEYLRLLREAALSIWVGRTQDLDRDGRAHLPVLCPPHDRVWDLGLTYSHRRKTFTSGIAGDTHFDRLDVTHQGIADLRYHLSAAATATLSFQYGKRTSTNVLRDFQDAIVSIGGQYRF